MREVTVAKSAGFCFGVKRAIEMVENEIGASDGDPIYTYGPIIHNEIVTGELSDRGVSIMPEGSDPADYPGGTVIIRSQGVTRAVEESLRAAGHRVVDATCPFVKKIHRIVEEYDDRGYRIVITGDPTHPEVEGIMGWIKSGRCDCVL